MQIKKVKNSFNDYSVEMSWGQLMAIHAALEASHADPIADETFAELSWYLENVPGPGEDEEEIKAAKEAEQQQAAGGDGGDEGRDLGALGAEVPLDDPTAEESDVPVSEVGDEMPGGPSDGGSDLPPGGPSDGNEEADSLLAAPPAE